MQGWLYLIWRRIPQQREGIEVFDSQRQPSTAPIESEVQWMNSFRLIIFQLSGHSKNLEYSHLFPLWSSISWPLVFAFLFPLNCLSSPTHMFSKAPAGFLNQSIFQAQEIYPGRKLSGLKGMKFPGWLACSIKRDI